MVPRGTSRRIADELREAILSNDFAPGSVLPSESQLAARYGASRGTIRAALMLLSGHGLVEVVPGRGRRVVGGLLNESSGTKWAHLATVLRERLNADKFALDAPMPSEAALIEEFQVSRNTVRRAYRHLVEAGLVVIRQGVGAFPAPR